jgi:hypothetical protein
MQVKWPASPTERRSKTRFVTRSSQSPTVTKKPNASHISSVFTCPLSRLLGRRLGSLRSVGVVRAFEDLERLCERHALVWTFSHRAACTGSWLTLHNAQAGLSLALRVFVRTHGSVALNVHKGSVEQQTISIRLQLLSVCNHSPEMSGEHGNGLRISGNTYPFGKLRMRSRCAPSGWKLETRNQLVWRLSLLP